MKYYYLLQITCSMWICVKIIFVSVMHSCISSIITPVFSVTWSSESLSYTAQETCIIIIIHAENCSASQYFCGNHNSLPFKNGVKKKRNKWIISFIKDALIWSKNIYNVAKQLFQINAVPFNFTFIKESWKIKYIMVSYEAAKTLTLIRAIINNWAPGIDHI